MVLPGIQALFGFQMVAVFNSTFKDLPAPQENLRNVAILLVVIATAVLTLSRVPCDRDAGGPYHARIANAPPDIVRSTCDRVSSARRHPCRLRGVESHKQLGRNGSLCLVEADDRDRRRKLPYRQSEWLDGVIQR